jgi:hypothetical protein
MGVGVLVGGGEDNGDEEFEDGISARRSRRRLIIGKASSIDAKVPYGVAASRESESSNGKLLCAARGLGTSSNKRSSSGTGIEVKLFSSSCRRVVCRRLRNIGDEGSMF